MSIIECVFTILPFGKNYLKSDCFYLDFTVRECYLLNMKVTDIESISKLVKERRLSLGLTQAQTAEMCNVGNRFFSELENAKSTLQIDKVLHCLEMLGINLYAVNREDDSEKNK